MGLQAIDQNIFPEVLAEGNRTHWSFQIPKGKLFDLLPTLPLDNCSIT